MSMAITLRLPYAHFTDQSVAPILLTISIAVIPPNPQVLANSTDAKCADFLSTALRIDQTRGATVTAPFDLRTRERILVDQR
jgi:hypothetical protein